MCRRLGLGLVLAVSLGVAACEQRPATAGRSSSRPNVVFWLVDTLRADHLGAYGHPAPTSPFLDTLAGEGVVFEQCRAQGSWTKPSMAALLTSRYPSATGMRGLFDRLDDSFTTFPETLQAAGYHTMGLSANPIMGRMSNYQQGFDRYWELQQRSRIEELVPLASGSAARLVDEAIRWLDERPAQPFLLYLHTIDPHELYKPAPEYLRQFADAAGEAEYRQQWVKLAASGPQLLANQFTADRFARAGIDPHGFIDYGRRLYDGDILATDTAIRRLWTHLVSHGFSEDLVFVLTSDHGEEFFEHGGTSHGYSLYDELLRVPLVIRAPPRVPAGLRIASPVRSIDIYPTLLDLLGLPIPDGLDGRTLRPLINGRTAGSIPHIYAEKLRPIDPTAPQFPIGTAYAVVAPPWKFVLNLESPSERSLPARELYRVDVDPGETDNVAAAEPHVVAELEADVRSWAETTARRAPPVHREQLPAAMLERLRQLGYLTADEPPQSAQER
jgi:arylsulfatase A-like enzyme